MKGLKSKFQITSKDGPNTSFSATSNAAWLTVSQSANATPATLTISVSAANLTPGNYSGQIAVAGGVNQLQIPVSFTVLPPNSITLSSTSINFNYVAGTGPASPQTINVTSTGTAVPFNSGATTSIGGNWLTISQSANSTPATITASINPVALGARIGQMRELRGLSLGALAEQADGLAKSYLAKLERGEVENPGLRTLSAIARALDVTVADLLPPAPLVVGSARETLLADQADLSRVLADLPDGLGDFVRLMEEKGQAIPAQTIRALALAEFRGRRPQKIEDWQFLYDAFRRSARS